MLNNEIISALSAMLDTVYATVEYPALNLLMQEWKCTLPFEGLRVLVATPVFRNTMLEYLALLCGGAELAVGRAGSMGTSDGSASESSESSMPCDEKIVEFLGNIGVDVLAPRDVLALEAEGDYFDLILDCAGQFSKCHPRYGFVELTRSGVHFFENSEVPVFVADSGIVKRIETSLGTGEGYVRALKQLGYADFEGKNFVVFGSGKVGSGIVLQLLREGASVQVVTDKSYGINAFLDANGVPVTDCHELQKVAALIREADFVVTATGVKDALANPALTAALNETHAVLANMGVEDEFGEGVPESRVLAKKSPLNFILEEPTHLKYIDASLALHAALGERLMQEVTGMVAAEGGRLRNPPADLEQRLLMMTIQNGSIGPEIMEMLGGLPGSCEE